MRTVIDRDGARKADLAAIHIAKAQLGWDDGTYRDILFTVCCVRSSAELDFAGRKRFLEHLRDCIKQLPSASGPARVARSQALVTMALRDRRRSALTPPQRKMWSLWQQLADAGLVTERRMPALLAYVKRQTHVDRLEWLTGPQEQLVIESLRQWLARSKVAA